MVITALLFSWYELYRTLNDFVEGVGFKEDSSKAPSQENSEEEGDHLFEPSDLAQKLTKESADRLSVGQNSYQALLDSNDGKPEVPNEQVDLVKAFRLTYGLVTLALTFNSFCVIFHFFDEKKNDDTEETLRYKMGSWGYFINFILLACFQVGVLLSLAVMFFKLRSLLKPSYELALSGTSIEQDPKEIRLASVRLNMSPKYLSFNIKFLVLILLALSYSIVYYALRFNSEKAFTDWIRIPPKTFYYTFAIETAITIWLFTFVF